MGEYVWTIMTVGGKASTKVIEEDLYEAACCDFPGGDGSGSAVEELIASALLNDESVCFQGERNWGNAETLEAFCIENGLPYHKSWSAASGAFDAGIAYWAPGMDAPAEESANDDGEPVASLSWLEEQFKEGKDLAAVIAELRPASSTNVPKLETDDLISRMESAA